MTSNDNNHCFKKIFDKIKNWRIDKRLQNYKHALIISGFLLLFVSFMISFIPYLKFFSQALSSAAVVFIVSGILQAISRNTLIKILSADISDAVIKSIKNIVDNMLPNRIYSPTDSDLILETKECLERIGLFKFMSISGLNLLTERLPASVKTIHRRITIKLLLLDPTEVSILETRVNQMRIAGEQKSVDDLKDEIILCIIAIFCLRNKYRALNFEIRFHKEHPTFRLEFFGDGTLYLSYYRSQRSSSELGPILKYECDKDIFVAFEDYFTEVWKGCERKIIVDDTITVGSAIKAELVRNFGEDIITSIDIDNKDLSTIWTELQDSIKGKSHVHTIN